MRRVILFILIITTVGTLLTGCYDAREVDDNIYVLAIGLDKGISNKLRLTFQFNAMKENKGSKSDVNSGAGSGDVYKIVSLDVPSFYAGLNMFNTSLPRKINLSHAKYLVFSEELGKMENFSRYIAPLVRYREARRTMTVIVSKGSALDFIKENKPYIGALLSKNQEGLIKESDDTSFYPRVNLNDLYNSFKSPYGQPIAICGAVNYGNNFETNGKKWNESPKIPLEYYAGELPRYGDNKIEFFGCALADGDKIVSALNGVENRAMLAIRGEFRRGVTTIRDPLNPKDIVSINLSQPQKPKISLTFEDGKPIINLKVKLDGEIYCIESTTNYAETKLTPILEKSFEEELKKVMDETIKKCQKNKCDVFGFGYKAVKQFKTIQEWEEYNWLEKFAMAEITTDVKVTIRRTGELLNISPIIQSKGRKY